MQYIVIITAFIQFGGIISYIRSMIYGSIRPNKVSWLVRSIAPMIATAAALYNGATRSALPIFMSWFGPLLIFIISLSTPQAYRKIETSDYICWWLSLIALWGWYITNNPLVGTLFAIGSDFLAGVPTYRKSRNHPESESIIPYLTGILGAYSSLFVSQSHHLTEIFFPIYLILFNISLIFTIKRKELFIKRK